VPAKANPIHNERAGETVLGLFFSGKDSCNTAVDMNPSNPRICIFGTHHAYQYKTKRRGYFQNVKSLIQIHSVDLVAEEATGATTYAEVIADDAKVLWKNVDLSPEERKHMPDLNPLGIGTQIDFDLHSLREWLWVIRTAKSIKHSALMICGFAHTTGVADKFRSVGFDVETHVYFDGTDNGHIENRIE